MFKDLSYELQLRNITDTDYRALRLGVLYAAGSIYIYDTFGLRPAGVLGTQYYDLFGYDVGAAAYETVARVRSHATQPYFEIPRAGNIQGLGTGAESISGLNLLIDLNEKALMAAGYLGIPIADVGVDILGKIYYDGPSDEIRVYDGAAWNVH